MVVYPLQEFPEGKIPSFSVVNNMHVAPVPPELSYLNVTEKRLICRVQAFMKLIVLPYGQRALQGHQEVVPDRALLLTV